MDTTSTEITIHSLAAEMASWFESRTRDNGDKFLSLRNGHPEWMQQICFDAHKSPTIGTIMPDDIRYEMINECLDVIADCTDADELEDRKYDLNASDNNNDLLQWLASHNCRANFCDAYRHEMGESCTDIMGQIRNGCLYEVQEVFGLLIDAFTAHLEELTPTNKTLLRY